MSKFYVLCLFVVSLFFCIAIFYPVRAGYNQSTTEKKAVEEGWAKFIIPSGDTDPKGPACTIRTPSEAEISSLISYCKTQPVKIDYNPPPDKCDSIVRDLAQRSCDDLYKPTPLNKPINTPTLTATNTPTLTLTSTSTPILVSSPASKQKTPSILARLNSDGSLREIVISILISIVTVTTYHFAIKKWIKKENNI